MPPTANTNERLRPYLATRLGRLRTIYETLSNTIRIQNYFGRSTNGFSGVGLKGKGSTPSPNLKHSWKLCPKKTDKERGAQKEERKEYKLLDKDARLNTFTQILSPNWTPIGSFKEGLIPIPVGQLTLFFSFESGTRSS